MSEIDFTIELSCTFDPVDTTAPTIESLTNDCETQIEQSPSQLLAWPAWNPDSCEFRLLSGDAFAAGGCFTSLAEQQQD
ncbi:hypothetical protein [Rubripirellula obstinata]|uniref:hypothetical protein n=1 Tax=Rubripirellula obstinata TaxID=406547 RepID=UPI0008319938|nr:hypothetical protein [Rubripirellula obstinata]